MQVNGATVKSVLLTLGRYRVARLGVPKGESKVVVMEAPGAASETPLLPTRRHGYEDFARGFIAEDGKPEIAAATHDGLPCWGMKGPGILANMGISINRAKNHKGVTFKLNPGQAKGAIEVRAGHAGKYYMKKLPLDFTGWKEFSITQDEFDVKPDFAFQESPFVYFKLPAGTVYISDFRCIPFTAEDAAKAAAVKIKRPQVVV